MLDSWSLALMKTNPVKHISHVGLTHFTLLFDRESNILMVSILPPSTASVPVVINMSFHRGSFRGSNTSSTRGRGSWHGHASAWPSRRAEPPPNLKPLGPTFDSINIKTLLTEEDAPTITGVEYIASYNWLSGKSPVILVPGEPRSPQD
jgi:hypothetical protein